MLNIKCIMHKDYGYYGFFPKIVYDYIVEYHGKEIADMVLKPSSQRGWSSSKMTEEVQYEPIMDRDESRFNKYLINAVEHYEDELKYKIVTSDIFQVDEYDGYERNGVLTFR